MRVPVEQFDGFRFQFTRLFTEWRARVPWLQGMAIGQKFAGGEPVGEDAVVFFVGEKVDDTLLESTERIPAKMHIPGTYIELPTDVVPLPSFRFLGGPTCSTTRPARGGDCIAPLGAGWIGTLGAVLKRKSDNKRFLLSASHAVLGVGGTLAIGQKICHPPGNGTIGNVSKSVTWTTLAFMPADAALTEVTIADDVEALVNGIGGPINGIADPTLKSHVQYSSANGLKSGQVIVDSRFIHCVDLYGFQNSFIIDAPGEEADSGSIVVNGARQAVGVVFAGNGLVTICSRMKAVDAELTLSDYDF